MKILVLLVGKTSEAYLKEGIAVYLKRLTNYISISMEILPLSSAKDKRTAIEAENKSIQSKLLPGDFLIILDESGTEINSRKFAELFEKWMVQGVGRVVFVIGGPFGLASELKQRAKLILSVSKFTFTHQMVRLILVEQIYRAMTIIRNEGYHHD